MPLSTNHRCKATTFINCDEGVPCVRRNGASDFPSNTIFTNTIRLAPPSGRKNRNQPLHVQPILSTTHKTANKCCLWTKCSRVEKNKHVQIIEINLRSLFQKSGKICACVCLVFLPFSSTYVLCNPQSHLKRWVGTGLRSLQDEAPVSVNSGGEQFHLGGGGSTILQGIDWSS